MRIALLADIHANREALTACLAHARGQGAERLVFLGDYVGYGADPEFAVETVAECVAQGALALRGNHDDAVARPPLSMRDDAWTAIAWTRGRLGTASREFLAGLTLTIEEGETLYVHAEASAPARWLYVTDAAAAARSLMATGARLSFCGHVHVPCLYGLSVTGKLASFEPVAGVAVPLQHQRRWLVTLGSVGQPRDGNPAACYAMLDTARAEITILRVPYDVEAAAAKILAAGLPVTLAERLRQGR
jgi:diadenosine tetraphosphatase ApaH/serine/threonine PP2A family protein phosphatase